MSGLTFDEAESAARYAFVALSLTKLRAQWGPIAALGLDFSAVVRTRAAELRGEPAPRIHHPLEGATRNVLATIEATLTQFGASASDIADDMLKFLDAIAVRGASDEPSD